jgi:uncharacterized protein YhhL (DUF1145 family)
MSTLKEFQDEKLPWICRLLLKIPAPNLSRIYQEFPWFEGIYYGIIVPLLLYFSWWYALCALVYFPYGFPYNYVVAVLPALIMLIFFARVQLERTLQSMRLRTQQTPTYDLDKAIKEYEELLKRDKRK